MSSDGEATRRQAWTAYWASGRLHSCADASDRNYEGAIGEFWRSHFSNSASGTRILDVATGNGPLPSLMHALFGDAVEIHAVDLSTVAPAWHDPVLHARIQFHSGVRIEALPFGDASFDQVVSQYGFEYADREAALAECDRVARPDARIALVMHHAESVLMKVGREELEHHAWLRTEEGLLQAASNVLPFIARVRRGDAPTSDALAARGNYNQAMAALAQRAAVSAAPDLLLEARDAIHGLVASVGPDPSPATCALQAYVAELDDARLRTAEMVDHALDDAALEELSRRFAVLRPDAEISSCVLRQAEGIVGWAWVAGPSDMAG